MSGGGFVLYIERFSRDPYDPQAQCVFVVVRKHLAFLAIKRRSSSRAPCQLLIRPGFQEINAEVAHRLDCIRVRIFHRRRANQEPHRRHREPYHTLPLQSATLPQPSIPLSPPPSLRQVQPPVLAEKRVLQTLGSLRPILLDVR